MIGYHYCSLETLLNIFRNKAIFLSDPLKMNDWLELKWYLERINDDGDAFQRMKQRAHFDFTYDELMQCINEKGQQSVYIACFSKEPDLLSQWRAYAKDGTGVSIGFDLEQLEIADNFLVEEVKYTDSVIDTDEESDYEAVADSFSTTVSHNDITSRDAQIEAFIHELIPVLAKYKISAFKEEKEVRLIYCDDLKFEKILQKHGAFNEDFIIKELEHDFRITAGNNITEFVKLEFKPTAIKEIYLGPKCKLNKTDTERLINAFLTYDSEVNIVKSKASYR